MSLVAEVMRSWFETTFDRPTYLGPSLPDMPDDVIIITLMPGGGLVMEGLIDQPAFQVAVRGAQFGEVTADVKANQIDKALLWGDYPHTFWGGRVSSCTRTGGAPSPLGSFDKGRRAMYTCSYIVRVDL